MPIAEGLTPTSRRRVLLLHGDEAGWWAYESENDAGHTDEAGHTYTGVTYTLRLNHGVIRTILAGEVEGYVLATADQYGDEHVRAIAYREGL